MTGTGQTYPVPVTLPGPAAQLGAGADATCARIGTSVYCWGSNNSGQVGIGPPSAMGNHDGCINFCKLTPSQVLEGTTPLQDVVDINVGYLGNCARKGDGALLCWGSGVGNTATPLTIGNETISDVALYTSCGSSNIDTAIRYLSRSNTLYASSQERTQQCGSP